MFVVKRSKTVTPLYMFNVLSSEIRLLIYSKLIHQRPTRSNEGFQLVAIEIIFFSFFFHSTIDIKFLSTMRANMYARGCACMQAPDVCACPCARVCMYACACARARARVSACMYAGACVRARGACVFITRGDDITVSSLTCKGNSVVPMYRP